MSNKKKEFVIKDSGDRKTFSTGMVRDTAEGKTRYDLLIPKNCRHPMLIRWAEHLTKGAVKYSPRNFEVAETEEELERAYESTWRHFIQWIMGEDDEDHAAAMYFNIQLAELIQERLSNKRSAKKLKKG